MSSLAVAEFLPCSTHSQQGIPPIARHFRVAILAILVVAVSDLSNLLQKGRFHHPDTERMVQVVPRSNNTELEGIPV